MVRKSATITLDEVEEAVISVQLHNHMLHIGKAFSAVGYKANLNTNKTHRWGLVTPDWDGIIQFTADVTTTGAALVSLYEASALTNNGDAMTILNCNRQSTRVCTCLAYEGCNFDDDAALRLDIAQVGAYGDARIGMHGPLNIPTILKKNIVYVVTVKSAVDSNNVAIVMEWVSCPEPTE